MSLRWSEWTVTARDTCGTLQHANGAPWRETFTRENVPAGRAPMDAAYRYARHVIALAREGRSPNVRAVRVFPRAYPGHGETLYVEGSR